MWEQPENSRGFSSIIKHKYMLSAVLWLLLGVLSFWSRYRWSTAINQSFDHDYWLIIKALTFIPWVLYTWLCFYLVERVVIKTKWGQLLFWSGVATSLVFIHPALFGLALIHLSDPIPGMTLTAIYHDVLLSLLVRDVLVGVLMPVLATVLVLIQHQQAALLDSSQNQATLSLKQRGQLFTIPVDEIYWIQASGNYSEINTASKTYLLRENIGTLEDQLSKLQFLRTHRSTLINTSFARSLKKAPSGWLIELANGKQLPVSRRRINTVRDTL